MFLAASNTNEHQILFLLKSLMRQPTNGANQMCVLSRCPNMAVKEAEDDENVDEDDDMLLLKDASKKMSQAKKKQTKNKITWVGEPIRVCTHLLLPKTLAGSCHSKEKETNFNASLLRND